MEDARTHLKEGDTVKAMIINIDRKTRNIQLSIKAKDSVENRRRCSDRMQTEAPTTGTTNLGALLKAKLDNKKPTGRLASKTMTKSELIARLAERSFRNWSPSDAE